jgi:hypothetical protein
MQNVKLCELTSNMLTMATLYATDSPKKNYMQIGII